MKAHEFSPRSGVRLRGLWRREHSSRKRIPGLACSGTGEVPRRRLIFRRFELASKTSVMPRATSFLWTGFGPVEAPAVATALGLRLRPIIRRPQSGKILDPGIATTAQLVATVEQCIGHNHNSGNIGEGPDRVPRGLMPAALEAEYPMRWL